jgi:hypothetical protein
MKTAVSREIFLPKRGLEGLQDNISVISGIQGEPLRNYRKYFSPLFCTSPVFRKRISLHAGFIFGLLFTVKMEATCSSESSVDFQRATRGYIPEDRTVRVKIIRLVGVAGAGIAQSVKRLAADWTAEVRILAVSRFFSSPPRPDRF